MIKDLIKLIRKIYGDGKIELHPARITDDDFNFVKESMRNRVDCYGLHVKEFENELAEYTRARHVIATCSGTAALYAILCHFDNRDEAWLPNYTFRATLNAVVKAGFDYNFSDVSPETLGMNSFWTTEKSIVNVPVWLFGLPYAIENKIGTVVEDACQALGTFYHGKHAGTFGEAGSLSFNGNKIITTGGGGAVLTDDDILAEEIREFIARDFNLRMPALNAALGLSQLMRIEDIISIKREIAYAYQEFFKDSEIRFLTEPKGTRSNYWLSTIILPTSKMRDGWFDILKENEIEARKGFEVLDHKADTPLVKKYEGRVLCLPSGIPD
jgi:perosamine synthetase